MTNPNFALVYAGDAYSISQKIMGRQSAGKALMNGVARRWPKGEIHGFGTGRAAGSAMLAQLKGDGFSGTLRWREAPGDAVLDQLGAVYYPAPVTEALAHARNARRPTAYSLFGVTHTLSSAGAMDQVAALALPPFQPWDALICTSEAALGVVTRLQQELRDWHGEHLGATRFHPVQLPVIPLGIDAPSMVRLPADIAAARQALDLNAGDVAVLSAGRLTFHAKINPAPFYQALQASAARTDDRIVCIEAGVYPNAAAQNAYEAARAQLAPSVRFITVDGQDGPAYRRTWQAADMFVSLSDNIQETFGLTPLEAMAAGLPVIVSDWNGYKATVRDGIDGFRIPTTFAPDGAGLDLAQRHATERDTYDFYIGRVSMATAIDQAVLTDRIVTLATDPNLRRDMGHSGQTRACGSFDWPVILDRYVALAASLGDIRASAGQMAPLIWPLRPDPFALFAHYSTRSLEGDWTVWSDSNEAAVRAMLSLNVVRYVLDPILLPEDAILSLHRAATRGGATVRALTETDGVIDPVRIRALMWLYKLDLIALRS